MTVKTELSEELKDAMKQRDRARINVIRLIESEISLAKSAPGFDGDVDDELYVAVISSYSKRMDKARKEYEGAGERGREHAGKLAYEIEYLSRWLPRTLGEDKTRQIVKAAMAELGVEDPAAMGQLMGHIMKSGHEGLDGGLVSRLVKEELSAG